LVVQTFVFPAPMPLFAAWMSNAVGESKAAKHAITEKRLICAAVLLGDETFGGADLTALYKKSDGWLLIKQLLLFI
jgi:hypothetical protein